MRQLSLADCTDSRRRRLLREYLRNSAKSAGNKSRNNLAIFIYDASHYYFQH